MSATNSGVPPASLPAIVTVNLPDVPGRLCPYCKAPAPGQVCSACQRDTTARRRVCPKCGRLTPSVEPACLACGARFKNDLAWKIPIIVVIFLFVVIVTIAVYS
jgi:hypothetical protein